MATVAKFVQSILIYLAYLVPLDVSDIFLGDALIKLYETLSEYHMPCEVLPLWVDFSKMTAVAIETAKMQKQK
jgi:hypothetical protein